MDAEVTRRLEADVEVLRGALADYANSCGWEGMEKALRISSELNPSLIKVLRGDQPEASLSDLNPDRERFLWWTELRFGAEGSLCDYRFRPYSIRLVPPGPDEEGRAIRLVVISCGRNGVFEGGKGDDILRVLSLSRY